MREGTSRGQAAMEYLMTYGWALLVVAVAGIAIWQLGFLDISGSAVPGKTGFTQITLLDWQALGSSDEVKLILVNHADNRQTLVDVSATVEAGGSGGCSSTENLDIGPGATHSVTLSGCTLMDSLGEYYKLEITITYTNPASALSHSSVGQAWGPIE